MDEPKELKVGGKTYAITWDQESWEASNQEGYGYSNHRHSRISINPNQSTMEKADTLLHEMLHCCLAQVGNMNNYKVLDELEEHVVTTTTPWLLTALRDNPDIVKYLLYP
jgi:Zn-dependent peptidase ImmA (M78 family)